MRQTLSVLSRRQLLRTGAGVVLPVLLAGCSAWQDLPVAVASHVWVGYEPMFFARDKGWLDAQKVTLVQTHSSQDSIAALRAGTVQAAALTLDEVLTVRSSGLPLSIVLVFNESLGADMVLARPGISSLAQLKGQRIGYEASSVGEIMLVEVLQVAGLKREDVRLEKILVDQQVAAWQSRTVDAFITYEPVAAQLLAQGMTRLFDSRQIPDTIMDVLAVRTEALDARHAKAFQHLISVHFQAIDAIVRNPQDAAYRLSGRLNLPPAEVMTAFKGLMLSTPAMNYRFLAGTEPQLLGTSRRVADILQRGGLLGQAAPTLDLINPSYLPTEGLLK